MRAAARADWMRPRLRERASLLGEARATSVAVDVSAMPAPALLQR